MLTVTVLLDRDLELVDVRCACPKPTFYRLSRSGGDQPRDIRRYLRGHPPVGDLRMAGADLVILSCSLHNRAVRV
jgi:hypothetical protein